MIEHRLRTLVRYLGATKLAGATNIERRRWQTVATNLEVKARIEDLEELLKAFPEYELWLWKGEVDLANGQIAPDLEDATGNSVSPDAK
ncbi:DNA-binding protein [Pseudomonas knackmussii]|uniref:DNA-binding protein n=1 Tax=Pseudomonas knackmussii TaxID=65741 RepID=UPI001362EA75|nr:DNA-binding protein [Pseudomonas knackmussii]